MPSVLSRLRGLLAPTTGDQPLRLADGSGGGGGSLLLTTKGDLLGFDTTANRVPVGADGDVLTADSTATLGVSYKTPSAGGSITVSDGSTTLTGVTDIVFTGATVSSGGSGVADVTVTGGGGGGGDNVTPDSHPTPPTGIGAGPNDDFETGSSIDTSGTRYSGATPWTPFNLSTGSSQIKSGSLLLLPSLNNSNSVNGYSQPTAGSTFTYTAKISVLNASASSAFGMFLGIASSLKFLYFNYFANGQDFLVQRYTDPTTFSSGVAAVGSGLGSGFLSNQAPWFYMQMIYDGTSVHCALSLTGVPGTFIEIYTEAASTFLGAAPDIVGIVGNLQTAALQGVMTCDWFRRTA